MRVLIAFDKFKDSMTATQACNIAQAVIKENHPDWEINTCPLADGGEGFCEILTEAVGGELKKHTVLGPQFIPQEAHLGYAQLETLSPKIREQLNLQSHGKLAIIEMAQASGIEAIPQDKRDPWIATTYGTGQLILEAANAGAHAILLGLGGSATNDIGLGALEAIGLELFKEQREPLEKITPKTFESVVTMAGEILPHIPPIHIACDVQNPLLGPMGCTAIFGPQKGLKPEDRNELEKSVGTMAKRLCRHFDKPEMLMAERGAGAAGGIAFGLQVGCDAELTSGFELVQSWLDLENKIDKADLIITGEGCFDNSSLQGKGPGSLLISANEKGKKLKIISGKIGQDVMGKYDAHAISPTDMPLQEALAQGPELLQKKVRECI